MDGRREVSIISHRPVTSSDLKQERSCFRRCVLTFLQLVVALKQALHMGDIVKRHIQVLAKGDAWIQTRSYGSLLLVRRKIPGNEARLARASK